MMADQVSDELTLLKALLRARHWQKHTTFVREWDNAARAVDPKLVGSAPRHAQFYRWLRGDLRELPYPDACRVLEALFPGHAVKDLFRPCTPEDLTTQLFPQRAGSEVADSAQAVPGVVIGGIMNAWPRTNPNVLDDLVERVTNAEREISIFGLARNFYAKDEMLPLFEERATQIPVTFYVMDPHCGSRRDRYRLEPVEAAMEDPARYIREVLRPLFDASRRVTRRSNDSPGIRIYTYNFPCSFAIEKIDSACRVILYGHGKRGTEGPIFVFREDTPYGEYFDSQMRWLERLASEPREPWTSKGLVVHPLQEADLGA